MIKKRSILLCLLLVVFTFCGTAAAQGPVKVSPVEVLVNGRAVSFPDAGPFIDGQGRTQAPARFVAQELGAGVTWDEATAAARISGRGISITLVPGQNTATVNGKEVALDSGALLMEDRIYVPVRFIAETLGASVQWDEAGKTVSITDLSKIIVPVSESALNAEESAIVEESRLLKGVHQKGELVVFALGPQPNPGYGVEFVKSEMSWEQLKVYVRLTRPEPGKMYAMVITYPYIAGKASLPPNTTIRFINAETGETL